MEIWQQSPHIDSNNRIIASQPQSRAQVMEVPFREKANLTKVEYGEILITIIKGKGFIMTAEEKHPVCQGDQVYLKEGDEFALSAARKDEHLVAQSYWAPSILDQIF